MGEVWRATHTPTGAPAAVKFDLQDPTPEYRAAFFHEVRLVAGLDHPSCVQVLDAGTVTAHDEVAAIGRMPVDAPWLAMELALGGSLSRDRVPPTWDAALHVLRSLLVALQHAHARGVVHRDIKFGNLLLAGPPGDLATVPTELTTARIVLSDFGIGHQLDRRDERSEHSAGTPQYMAPEQVNGAWRDMGPWTDLYQVGVLGWALTTGMFPFRAPTTFALLAQHLHTPPPAWNPAIPAPTGIEAVLRRLLAKAPSDRYPFAAHVLADLDALPSPLGGGVPDAAPDDEELPTVSLRSRSTGSRTTRSVAGPAARPGTGLWGLRVLPLVGRSTEQERLRIALRRAMSRRSPELVVLGGPAGSGRTRLARDLREWALHEGLADGLIATVGPHGEGGLLEALARHLRVDGLTRPELRDRLLAELGPGPYTDALDRVLGGERLSPGAQHKTLAVALRTLALRRPLVLVLDDAHHDPNQLAAVDAILGDLEAHPAPLLVVVTTQDEALAESPQAEAALEALVTRRRADRLALGPLGEVDHRALVRSLIGLSGDLAQIVEARSVGNPALAVQWVGHWVEQGWLVPGRRGLELAPGAPARLPDDHLAVWRSRIDRLATTPDDRTALQLAAVLGHGFDVAEWTAGVALLGLHPTADLLAHGIRGRLLAAEDRRVLTVRFSHGLVVDALHRQAREAGVWVRLHALAAEVVAGAARPDPTRLARLQLEAGQLEAAADSLRWALEDQLYAGDARSDALLDKFRLTLDRLDLPDHDERRANLWLVTSWMRRLRSEFDAAEAAARQALDEGTARGWSMVPARALRELGQSAMARGDFERALTCFHRAAKQAADVGRAEFAAHCTVQEGDALLFLGRLDDAREAYAEVHDAFEGNHAWRLSHEPPAGLAAVAIRAGDPEAAERHLAVARQRAERARVHGVLANILNLQGEVARQRGDLVEAARLYAEAADRFRALELADAAWPSLNVGLCLVLDGRFDEAAARMALLLRQVEKVPVVALCARYVAFAAAAGQGDWAAFAEHHAAIGALQARTPMAEKDLALLAGRAAALARDADAVEPEADALALQLEQLERLGLAEELPALKARLQRLRRT